MSELAFMGLPSIVIVLAHNQAAIGASLQRAGVSVNLGGHAQVTIEAIASSLQSLLANQSRRETMSRRGRALLDGRGSDRVTQLLHEQVPERTSTS